MNAARVASLLRELADALEDDELGARIPAAPASKPRPKRPRVRHVPRPLHEPSTVDRVAARKLLRREGLG